MKWCFAAVAALVACYGALFGVVLAAMVQPPERFGSFMKRVPAALVWGALPARPMWLWARRGDLAPGALAPDFTLPRHDRSERMTLSSYRGQRPVVLIFGSYT